MEKIDTLLVEEVQDLNNTVRGTGEFGSTGVKSRNDIGQISEKNESNGQNERTGEKKESEVKNETRSHTAQNGSHLAKWVKLGKVIRTL